MLLSIFVRDQLMRHHSQDTNTTQYQLMKYLAAAHGCVTVVGDPDQSSEFIRSLFWHKLMLLGLVYGWRSAEIENLAKMRKGSSPKSLHLGQCTTNS